MEPTSIDVALQEMLYVAHCINRFIDEIENNSCGLKKLQARYFPLGFIQRTQQWQEQLDRLCAMKASNQRKAIYDHKGISQLATFFGLKYPLTNQI